MVSIDMEQTRKNVLNLYTMLKKAVELRKQGKLTRDVWHREMAEFRKDLVEDVTDEEWNQWIWQFYLLSRPRHLEIFLDFVILDFLHEDQKMSIRQISRETGIPKSKVQRILTLEADKERPGSIEDIAKFMNASSKTIRKIVKDMKEEDKDKKQLKLG